MLEAEPVTLTGCLQPGWAIHQKEGIVECFLRNPSKAQTLAEVFSMEKGNMEQAIRVGIDGGIQ